MLPMCRMLMLVVIRPYLRQYEHQQAAVVGNDTVLMMMPTLYIILCPLPISRHIL